jgi:hypothetical protein
MNGFLTEMIGSWMNSNWEKSDEFFSLFFKLNWFIYQVRNNPWGWAGFFNSGMDFLYKGWIKKLICLGTNRITINPTNKPCLISSLSPLARLSEPPRSPLPPSLWTPSLWTPSLASLSLSLSPLARLSEPPRSPLSLSLWTPSLAGAFEVD